MSQRLFSFYSFVQLSPAYWAAPAEKRQAVLDQLLDGLRQSQFHSDLYQVFPVRADVDLLVWCSLPVDDGHTPARFFQQAAELFNPLRAFVQPKEIWWGMTRPSDYSRGKSAQEIDPIEGQRCTYLVVYPFTKTAEWYRMGRDTRQGMMNEHIRTGHQHPEIKQLLLYSTGLQDQEFIVVYETEDLGEFSTLVTELRSSEARRFTERDTPIFTAIYHTSDEIRKLFA